eukprot:Skav227373  [mRNA]  locus=scaffold2373:169778:172590:+ [translate_table: standard]
MSLRISNSCLAENPNALILVICLGLSSKAQAPAIGKGLQLLAAKGVLPGLLGKGAAQGTTGPGKGPQLPQAPPAPAAPAVPAVQAPPGPPPGPPGPPAMPPAMPPAPQSGLGPLPGGFTSPGGA